MVNPRVRNIAIIAHVDHGKTTLVDKLLREGGVFRANQQVAERAMDSMELEREKGITIRAKNTSVHWRDITVNIVDTPGHADFGGEVERVLKMVDGVLLLVDAHDGPQAQTRFVLRKALSHGLKLVVVINKIDRENADPAAVHDQVLELLLELGASDEQFNCPFVYASARDGYAVLRLDDPRRDMTPLFETILAHIPPPVAEIDGPFRMLVSNIGWDDYVGRVAIGRISSGRVVLGMPVWLVRRDGSRVRSKVTKVFEYTGLDTHDSVEGVAGTIIGLAGFEDVDIGETLVGAESLDPLPFVEIDPPTIEMYFAVNDGPLAGRDGKFVTSRQLRERLWREMKTNIGIRVEETEVATTFRVKARGPMQVAVLVEQMRREGYEVLVSRPSVIFRREEGRLLEPYETLWIEVPDEDVGGVLQNLANRKAQITNMEKHAGGTTIEATIPTRGIIGLEIDLVNQTSGRGVLSHLFKEYGPHAGEVLTRTTGTLVSTEAGEATAYALESIQERGRLFIAPGDQVYEGMLVGENPRMEDIPVNPTKTKQLTNFRSQGEGRGIQLSPPLRLTLERAVEYIAPDEYVEATPRFLRLRKKVLRESERRKLERAERKGC